MADNKQVTTSAKKAGSEPHDDTKYESSIGPVLWLLVPFVLTIAYGAFASH
jgi:hypothetical protein